MSRIDPYSDFIKALPQADIPLEGLSIRLVGDDNAQVGLFELEAGTVIPTHSHGPSWGIVVEGKVEITTAGEAQVLTTGDSFAVQGGVEHGAKVLEAARMIEVFSDAGRFKAK